MPQAAKENTEEKVNLANVGNASPNPPANTSPERELRARLERNQTRDDPSAYISEKHNSKGTQVRWWKERINEWLTASGKADKKLQLSEDPNNEVFDAQATEMLREFQRASGLNDDGVAGPRSFREMAKFLNRTNSSDLYFERTHGLALISDDEFFRIIGGSSNSINSEEYSKVVDRLKAMGIDPSKVTAKPSPEMIADLQKIMDRESNNKAKITAEELIDICIEKSIDWRLGFLMGWKESHWGAYGRANRTFNIFNVGNTDSGAHKYMGSNANDPSNRFREGVRSWADFMHNGYETTLEGFIATNGRRTKGKNIGAAYASSGYTGWLQSQGEKIGLLS